MFVGLINDPGCMDNSPRGKGGSGGKMTEDEQGGKRQDTEMTMEKKRSMKE